MIKKLWKYSVINFYIANFVWNIQFWLFAKKIFKTNTYYTYSEDFLLDEALRMIPKKTLVSKRRFIGYFFKGNLYLDNPGLQLDYDVWKTLKRKKVI